MRKEATTIDRCACIHTASSLLHSLQYDVPQDCLRAYPTQEMSKRQALSPSLGVLSASLGYESTIVSRYDSFEKIEFEMCIEQEVGKGHIEPAIYITPYLKREREKHTNTHKQRSDRGVTLALVYCSYAFPNFVARSQWQEETRPGDKAKEVLPCVREKK